ncbi:MAG: zinc carboxypeptidase [Elusimicrobia bacterium]|nr:zinc carboxypeptidase [Elusimicrobiota bacterium]
MKLIILSLILSINSLYALEKNDEAQKNLSFEKILTELISRYENPSLPAPQMDEETRKELESDDRMYVSVAVSDKRERTKLLELGMDIIEVKKDHVSGFISKKDLPYIERKEFSVMEKKSIYEWAKQFEKDFPAADSAYHNYKETYDYLSQLASANKDIASLFSIGKTIEGRDIWVLRLNSSSKGEAKSSKPGAVFVGNHHAREHLSNEVPLLFAAYLLDNKQNPEIKKYLNSLDIYIIPMFNPDGAEYDIATGKYRWHRKNMRKNSNGTIGVDLNRNYDTTWCKYGSSSSPGADTYCGTGPFSEPESSAMRDFILARKNIKTLQSYHSYGSMMLYPWGGSYDPVPNEKDRNAFIKMAQKMGELTGYDPKQSSDLYAASGDTCDWAYEKAGIFAFTTELEGSSFYPGASIIKTAVEKNINAAVYLLSMTDNPYK